MIHLLSCFSTRKLISCLEAFWVDITLRNPLDTEVNLANPTVIVESSSGDAAWVGENIAIDILEEIVLNAKELRTVRGSVVHPSISLTIMDFRFPLPLSPPNRHH